MKSLDETNELIDKLLAQGDDLSVKAAEALKELVEFKQSGGAIRSIDGSWWKPERIMSGPGRTPGIDGWIRVGEEEQKPRIITDV